MGLRYLLRSALSIAIGSEVSLLGASAHRVDGRGELSRQLELSEFASFRLPRGTAVLGGLLGGRGNIVFWTPRDIWLVSGANRTVKRVCGGIKLAPRYGLLHGSPSRVTILDSLTNTLVDIRQGGQCIREPATHFDARESVIAGLDDGWVQMITERGAPHTVRWVFSSEVRVEPLATGPQMRLPDATDLVVRGERHGVLLGE